jgi:hypothetical protein
MSKKTLIAGPWVGEFGWELFAWQAYVRALSRNFGKTTIICRESSAALYADFANDFIYANPKTGLADSFFMYGLDTHSFLQKILMDNKRLLTAGTTIFGPRRIGVPPYTHHTVSVNFGEYQTKPEYIMYGGEASLSFDYVLHIRDRDLRKEDNWSIENWKQLLALLVSGGSRVACIGTIEESGCIEGAEDLRGMGLDALLNILSSAKCAFGPSSGPMHLASLCGCPHVVWSINQNFLRYTENWNPLGTPILFLSKYDWHPSAEYVYDEFVKWRKK